jgi:MFS transporter, DHA1 family, multidrug resistance protein
VHIFTALLAGGGATSEAALRRRNLLAVSLAAFLASVGFMVVMPLLPGLISEVVGGDVARSGLWLGLAISVSPLLTALTGPVWGALGDRYGRKAMIQRSLICIGIGIGLMAIAYTPSHVVILRAAIGGLGGVSVAALAAVTAMTPRRELGPAVGTLQAAQTAGCVVGPLMGGILGSMLGMREAFVASGVVFVLALVLVQWLYHEAPDAPAEPVSSRESERGGRVFGAGMVVALVSAFLIHFVEGGLLVMLPLEMERLGLRSDALAWTLGIGLSATYLAATVAALVAGRMSVGRSPIALMAGVLLVGLIALVPLAFVTSWWQFLGLRVLLALIVGAAPTLAYAAAAVLAPPERRGQMVGLMSSAGILGWAVSPISSAALAQISTTLLFGLDAVLYVLMALALLAADRGLLGRIGWPRLRLGQIPALIPNVGGSRHLLERLPSPTALLPRRNGRRYTPSEVTAALRSRAVDTRTEAILDAASKPWEWMPSDPRKTLPGLPRHADRMATILFLYRQGTDPEQIGRRFGPLGGGWAVDRTLQVSSKLIADYLNR